MKIPILSMFRHRRRNAVILLVGLAACCLVFLAWRDNLSVEEDSPNGNPQPGNLALQLPSTNGGALKFNTITNIAKPSNGSSNGKIETEKSTRLSFVLRDSSAKPNWNAKLYYDVSSTPKEFVDWRLRKQNLCDGKMFGYEQEFLEARDMMIDTRFCRCKLKGGELIESVINQAEDAEYYTFDMGCFHRVCKERPSYMFNGENHLNKWMFSLSTHDVAENIDLVINEFTIAVTRYEYANLFHTMTDWYNAFLVMQFFNRTSFNTNILIVDAHPVGALDPVWSRMFNSTVRLSGLPTRTLFRHLAWGIMGYNSLMKIFVSPSPPLVEEFRHFFLSAYNINTDRKINCERLNILFIWRRNYLAHPRNPTGFVSRKIKNEDQLIRYVTRRNLNSVVNGIQIDAYSMQQQLQYIADADILIGMHGAGLTHAMFLQKKAALIELVPNYWSPMAEHFKAICVWRGLIYKQWFNNDIRNEYADQSTNIPPHVMNTLIKNTVRELCVQ